ncbi:hypothetical protein J7J00_24780 [Bacillus sp. ISL-4]|uniref:hypothetical protein n=1 Tax=Bacillus sp. ISL-4 TaxID=2819125 RepID=UPI001BECB671|nr:hypothetical protein [Bacillus sp. ISL-4]MBT2668649.1 hypothetical protein [Bacillus sp. ISL-4]MBT2673377.1 hypothetical protein [Streptomyces sp. ISL-14]
MKEGSQTAKRKVRCDKKRDIKPTISESLNEICHDLSYVLNRPVKDVGEMFIISAINNRECIESLAMYFKRDYRHDNTIFRGDLEAEVIQKRNIIQKKRLHLRFKACEHDRISTLAFSMDCSVSLATTMLLTSGIRNTEIFNEVVDSELVRLLDPERLKRLRTIQKYINKLNGDTNISIFQIVAYVAHEVVDTTKTMHEKVNDWIDTNIKNIE